MNPSFTPCLWCGGSECRTEDAFHQFLYRHDLHTLARSGVGDGWLPLLDKLVGELKALGWVGEVYQIKERLGGLCFVASGTDSKMDARLRLARQAAGRICEVCGRPGRSDSMGSIAALCPQDRRARAWHWQGRAEPDGWYASNRTGLNPLGPAIRARLAELDVAPHGSAQPPAGSPLPPPVLGHCQVIDVPDAHRVAAAWQVVESWTAAGNSGHVLMAASRSDGANRMLALRSGVPLLNMHRGEVADSDLAQLAATADGLDALPVLVDDGDIDLRQLVAHAQGIAVCGRVGLLVLPDLDRMASLTFKLSAYADVLVAEHEVTRLTWALAELAVTAEELDCAVVAITAPQPTEPSPAVTVLADDASLHEAIQLVQVVETAAGLHLADLAVQWTPSGRLVPA